MKYAFHSTLLAAGLLVFASGASAADVLGTGASTAVTGQASVSTPISNTNIDTRANADVSARDQSNYHQDASERSARQNGQVSSSQDARFYADGIAPSSGARRNVPPSARAMGGIRGGFSYND